MSITITQRARFCASRATTSLATTPAAIKAKRSANPAGAVRIATSQLVRTDAFMERAKGPVFVNAATATRERGATSANRILAAKTASAQSHGSVAATRTGVEYSVTKVSKPKPRDKSV